MNAKIPPSWLKLGSGFILTLHGCGEFFYADDPLGAIESCKELFFHGLGDSAPLSLKGLDHMS